MIYEQHNIKTDMSQPSKIAVLDGMLSSFKSAYSESCEKVKAGFRKFVENVAEVFGYDAPNGEKQISSTGSALRALETQGKIDLSMFPKKPQSVSTSAISPCPPARTPKNGTVENISICLVETPEQRGYFREIVDSTTDTNNQNRKNLIGRQVKYLVKSDEDIVGVIGFDSPNLNSAERAAALCMDLETKKKYLHYFINLRIFYMRDKWEDYRHKAIEIALGQISNDFNSLYGYSID